MAGGNRDIVFRQFTFDFLIVEGELVLEQLGNNVDACGFVAVFPVCQTA